VINEDLIAISNVCNSQFFNLKLFTSI